MLYNTDGRKDGGVVNPRREGVVEMPKMIKSADLPAEIAAMVLYALNRKEVSLTREDGRRVIVSTVDPGSLTYPEGWYFVEKGGFRNKHNSTTGRYEEIPMLRPSGVRW